eukprot:scaffold3910_cov182-Amphora_coffeaeformis.AAC.6
MGRFIVNLYLTTSIGNLITSLPQPSVPHYLKHQYLKPHYLITANLITSSRQTSLPQTSLPHYLITANLITSSPPTSLPPTSLPPTSLPPYPITANSTASFKHDAYTHYVSSLPHTAHCSRKSLPPYRKKIRHIRSPVLDLLRPE